MNTNYLEKLEYFKILEKLELFCVTYIGKNIALNLRPSNNKEIVRKNLLETDEAINLLYRCSTPPISEIADNTVNIKTIESYGILSIKSILELTNILEIADSLKKYFYVDFIKEDDFTNLSPIFASLYSNNSIIKTIHSSILDENTLDDKASLNLSIIRKKQRNLESDIKTKLNNLIHSSTYSKYIQENVVTIRDNRYVIPVKAEYRSYIKGFIHDISSSGSTIFIEPVSVFELNSELANLKLEENIEIEKILQNLSKLFYPYSQEIKKDIECISNLDFIFAKAKYSTSIKGVKSNITDTKEIILKNAKHPLLDLNTATPISFEIGKNYNVLVITGPNTGGKTVTLKTVGLLTAMACSGLNIPAEKSSIYVFDNIFADIGDDQSISDSLSTFSSHIKNIVEITKKSTSNSLILLDELGSGTDPVEGSQLAISILDFFAQKGSIIVSTTHYQELKKYAMIKNGFENASVEFDVNTMSPTYKLLIGIPGKSNAFEISKKLGLNEEIINKAKSNLSKKDIDFEELLKTIYDSKSKIEKEKSIISEDLYKIEEFKKSLEKDNSNLLENERNIINNAKIEARNILLDAKKEANEIISKMNDLSNLSSLNSLRNKLNDEIKQTSKLNSNNFENIEKPIDKNKIKKGLEVYVSTLNKNGIILSNISKSNDVQVQVDNIRTKVNIKYLQELKQNNKIKNDNKTNNIHYSISKTQTINSELNIIGLNVDEAIPIVDKFLDDSYLAKLDTVRIVHGKGTGKLREGVQKFLKKNPYVSSFRVGTYGEGQMGVTIVELKK